MKFKIRNLKLKIGVAAILVALTGASVTLVSCKGRDHGSHQAETYYCPMHPQIQQDKPGSCPICSMDLVLKKKEAPQGTPVAGGEVPDALKGLAPVHLTAFKQQLIGLKTVPAGKGPVKRVIRTSGRFAAGGFAAAASDFTAAGQASPAGGGYLVADVYALDQPFLKVGQTAWVSPFSGSGPKIRGRVAQVYPYDGTQSRVLRVRVDLEKPVRGEIYANVEIETVTEAVLSVPPDAVLDTGLTRYVFLTKGDGHFTPVEVTLGFQGDDAWEITSGLKAGDQVVAAANFLLDSDSRLKSVLSSMSDTETDGHKH